MSTPSSPAVADVRATLQAFQDGYTYRSSSSLDTFMTLFVADSRLEVIGTNAINRSTEEWCIGQSAVRALIEADWQSWGDLVLDVADAHIHVQGDTAWLVTTGTVSQTIPLTQSFDNITTYLQGILNRRTALHIERELLLIILGATSALANTRDGDHYVWPLRLTAVLTREQEKWQFNHIHFSYPTIHDPDVRITES